MRQPSNETILALALSAKAPASREFHPGRIAIDAVRVVSLARAHRRLGELSCNRELTDREAKRSDSLQSRADAILKPYGLCMDHPWGLVHYAMPIGADGSSSTDCVAL